MTAIIGFCDSNGAFLAADSRRTDINTGRQWNEAVRKIVKLNEDIVISTGGLGTIGHEARDQLIDFAKNENASLDVVVNQAIDIFSTAYQRSYEIDPNHSVPLTCILAEKIKTERVLSALCKAIMNLSHAG